MVNISLKKVQCWWLTFSLQETTNHIAEALGISPGNLYYHFRNKQEIIRAIAEEKDARWEALYHLPPDRTPTLADIELLVRENFALVWDYRFFFRELSALTQRDPLLKARYQQLRRERLAAFEGLFAQFMSAGVARPGASPPLVANLARVCWLISDYWLPFLEIDGDVTLPEAIEQGAALYMQVLDPYVSDAGNARAIDMSGADTSSRRTLLRQGTRKES